MIGLLVAIFLWRIVGVFLAAFGLYIALAYAIQVRSWAQSKAAALPEILSLRGDEEVLDVGCRLGKLTVGIAGVDVWDRIEIPGNSPQRAYRNAQLEGVQEKVEFRTADIRALPFADNSFDLVTASSVINNLKRESERLKALREIHRVLRPGGRFLLLEPLLDLGALLLHTPLAVLVFSSEKVWLDLLARTEFVNLGAASHHCMGLFLVEKPV